ncbi:MAG: NADH:flavin oxidoreductase [Promethearchaeota archaeon]
MKIGKMELKNRFIRSATLENLAKENGEASTGLIKLFSNIAKGEVGLIISGLMYIHPYGQSYKYQTGIHEDSLVPSLKKLTEAIHLEGGKIAFQIAHGGIQIFPRLTKGPLFCPSGEILSPVSFDYSKEMAEEEIFETIDCFVFAARRAVEAGADSIQLHAAHGYLINEFLSPFYNRRRDKWGGSDENQFRFLREIATKVKKILPTNMPLLVKLNTNDYTPTEGITPPLSLKYAKWLVDLRIDAIEISCGSGFALFNMSRGDVPVNEIMQAVPDYLKEMAKSIYQDMAGKFDLEEGYNLDAAKMIKPELGKIPLILVGGLRNLSFMEKIVKNNYADFISMSRPFIREPYLVKRFKDRTQDKVKCISCNKCLGAIPSDYPIKCYANNWPNEKKITVYFE